VPINRDADNDNIQTGAFIAAALASLILGLGFLFCDLAGDKSRDDVILQNKINPNKAEAVSLRRLPGIGSGRAEAIVRYREQKRLDGEEKVFRCSDDIDDVEGIGVKTINNISNWLTFEN